MLRRIIGWLRGGNGARGGKPALHKTMELMLQSGNLSASDAQAVRFALGHPRMMRELARQLNQRGANDPNFSKQSFDVLEATPGKQRPILQWLWNNRQTILSIVWTLLGVFGIKLPPLPVIGPTDPAPVNPPAGSAPPANPGPQPVK